MDFVTTRSGVPIVFHDETAYPVTREYMQDIAIMDVDEEGVIDTLMDQIKESVFVIAGIDPTLPHDQWYTEWQSLMTVLQFSEAVHVLRDAAQMSAHLKAEEASA